MLSSRGGTLGVLLVLCLAAILPSTPGRASARVVRAPAHQSPHLYIMFMPGLCAYPYSDRYCHGNVSAQSRGRGTFGTLIAAMAAATIRYTPLYFSYNARHSTYYSVGDTHRSVAESAQALETQLRPISQRDHAATFDLIGHSLGGVVAADWAVTAGRLMPNPLLRRVNSIITFDSPLRGIPALYGNTLAAQIFGGAVLYSLRPDSPAIRHILSRSGAWWRSQGHLHTIANRADKIVPASEAVLGDSRVVNDSSCGRDLLFIRTCHGAVLSDAALNARVACTWVTNALQCVTPTATPTPPPATSTPLPPSPTATETPAPTPAPTPSATPAASPTLTQRNVS